MHSDIFAPPYSLTIWDLGLACTKFTRVGQGVTASPGPSAKGVKHEVVIG